MIDRVAYYANSLSPWIAARDRSDKFLIRHDPRDLSRIWVLDPQRNIYIEVPYRTLSNPAVTIWEHRAAIRQLRVSGRTKVDEAAIFKTVEQMRAIVDNAATRSRAARRSKARRTHFADKPPQLALPKVAKDETGTNELARPFDDIEEW